MRIEHFCKFWLWMWLLYVCLGYWGDDKSLARPGRKQARKHVKDVCDFNNIETRAVIKFLFLQGKAPKEIHAILTETLSFLVGLRIYQHPYIKWGCHWTKCLRQWTGITLIFSHEILLIFVIFTSLLCLLAALISGGCWPFDLLDSQFVVFIFLKICCKESMYSMFMDKLQNCSLDQFL